MGKVLIGIGASVAAAAVVVAALYFHGDVFHGRPAAGRTQWVLAPLPSSERSKAQISLRKDFGPWRLTCTRQEGAPKVGIIQNLGIVQATPFKARPCETFIRMRNAAAPGQTMVLGFRYRADLPNPEVSIGYVTLGRPNVIYRESGQVVDLDKKQKPEGGFFMGQFASRNPGYLEAKAQEVHLQLAGRNLTLPTKFCVRARCRASYRDADVGEIGPGAKIVVRLPGPPHGQPRDVDVPSQGLASALAELRRLSRS